MTSPATIVLLSGGQDSTTCLYWALRFDPAAPVLALSFDYGQRHRVELERAAEIAALAGVEHRVVRVDLAVPSFLTDGSTALRDDGLPATFVPGRNLIFLAHAYAIAGALGATKIVFGANAVDYSGYPDCRPKFVDAMARAGAAALDRSVHLIAPLLHKSKAEIVLAGEALGARAAIARSWSCYDPRQHLDPSRPEIAPWYVPCGRCAACGLRAKGFAEAGVADRGSIPRWPNASPKRPRPAGLVTRTATRARSGPCGGASACSLDWRSRDEELALGPELEGQRRQVCRSEPLRL